MCRPPAVGLCSSFFWVMGLCCVEGHLFSFRTDTHTHGHTGGGTGGQHRHTGTQTRGEGGWAGLKVWVVDGSRSPRQRGEALVDLEIPPAMGCIKAQADGIAVRRLPFRTLGFQWV